MTNQDRNNPLHGVGVKALVTELVEHYGWEVLAAQLNINCFKNKPSIASSHKFLHKTAWAREKTEAFYLYKFKQLPIPDDEQHELPPRERTFADGLEPQLPAIITESDREFFDDPISGPVFKQAKAKSRRDTPAKKKPSSDQSPWGRKEPSSNKEPSAGKEPSASKEPSTSSGSANPWAKWKS